MSKKKTKKVAKKTTKKPPAALSQADGHADINPEALKHPSVRRMLRLPQLEQGD